MERSYQPQVLCSLKWAATQLAAIIEPWWIPSLGHPEVVRRFSTKQERATKLRGLCQSGLCRCTDPGLLLTVKQEGTLPDPLLWSLAWRLSAGQSCLQLCISFSCRFLTDCSATLERASAQMRRLLRQRQAVRRSLWSLAVTAVDSRVFWCSTVRISSKVSCAHATLCTCSCRRSKFCASLLFRGDGDFCVRLEGILVMQLGVQSPCNVVSSGLSKAAAGSIADIGYLLQG